MLLRTFSLCCSLCLMLGIQLASPAQAGTSRPQAAKSSLKTVASRGAARLPTTPTGKAAPTAAVAAAAETGTLFRYDSCGCSGG